MNGDADALLARELGRLGGHGARWVSRFLPTNIGEDALRCPCSPDVARRVLESVLSQLGEIEPEPLGGPDSISAVVGSGYGGLNPALVTASVDEKDSGCEILIRAVAKEGLIKQRGGEQAAAQVKEAVEAALRDVR